MHWKRICILFLLNVTTSGSIVAVLHKKSLFFNAIFVYKKHIGVQL